MLAMRTVGGASRTVLIVWIAAVALAACASGLWLVLDRQPHGGRGGEQVECWPGDSSGPAVAHMRFCKKGPATAGAL